MALPGYGQGGNGAGDYANILSMISSGWGNQVTPFDIGLDLGPQQVGQAFQQGWGQMNEQRQQQLRAQMAQAEMAQRQAELQGKYDIASQANELGYAKMPHEIEMEKLRRSGLVEAAGVKGQGDWMKTIFGERGKDQRAAQKNQLEQQRIAGQDRRNDLVEQGLLQKDKPPPFKPDSMMLMQMVGELKAKFPKLSTLEAQDQIMQELQRRAATNAAGAKEAWQGGGPEQTQVQQGQQAQSAPSSSPSFLSMLFSPNSVPPSAPGQPTRISSERPDALRRWAASGMPLVDYLNQNR